MDFLIISLSIVNFKVWAAFDFQSLSFMYIFETWYMTIQRSIRLKWAFDDKNNNSILQGRALLYAKTIFWLQYSRGREILKKRTA